VLQVLRRTLRATYRALAEPHAAETA
jgi:hypothetical protein